MLFDKIKPIYHISDEMKYYLEEINRKLSLIKINDKQKRKYMITKSKVRSIHSSLAIEENSLSLLAVESLYEEKPVIGKRHEIQEVKNAIKVYNKINTYDYKNELDLINVHKSLMKYMNEDNGYRNHGEGVKRDNKIIYMAPESILVPSLMSSLFELLNNSDLNLIVLSSIFHYYFVSIHPFSDGNGRVARFWISLMLLKYNKNFEYIPIEEEIYLNREEYYKSIEECHNNGNANIFIRFMLITINTALDKLIMTTNFIPNKIQNKIIEFITNNNKITQNEIAEYIGVNVRTIKRNFKVLIDNSIIERIGSDKTGYWQIIK
jgi:Fic family protein